MMKKNRSVRTGSVITSSQAEARSVDDLNSKQSSHDPQELAKPEDEVVASQEEDTRHDQQRNH